MWNKPLVVLVFSALATSACESSALRPDAAEFDHGSLDVRVLKGEVLNEAPVIGRPSGLNLSGDVLWIRDATGDPGLHALDAATGRILESVGRTGAGPGEFRGLFGLSGLPGDSGAVWAFDLQLQRLTRVEPDRAPNDMSRMVHLEGAPRVTRVAWVAPNEIIAFNEYPRTRFALFDSTGVRVATVAGALLGDPSIPEAERLKAMRGGIFICVQPSGGFAIAYGTAGRIEFYDGSASLADTADVPYPSRPLFRLNDRSKKWRLSTHRVWYTGCDATDRNLYALFSGRDDRSYSPEEVSDGRFLHVFSWSDGRLVGVYRLDPPIGSITRSIQPKR